MNVQGPMARRVSDVRLGLQILMGAHPRDPWSITAPLTGPTVPRPMLVALVPEPPGGTLPGQIIDKVYTVGQWHGGFFHAVNGVGFSDYAQINLKTSWG